VSGGPIALVEDGDMILIDIPARSLAIVGVKGRPMDSNEVQILLDERKKKWTPAVRKHPPGILRRYTAQAVSAIRGAYLA
jgi:dihydroxy-acid dehydratase